ncbi:hypothetical protein BDN72DRAFT_823423 [Pluteus cervinus]|uniref:Uncharacterized protein n=1 Tax=Pluteus cervinus TaxID=181527 RepID=A0ACD3ALF5_9AGAR|nr:hypothetical protein BDN72DRAFT_823423 [Pluteus cervinus]
MSTIKDKIEAVKAAIVKRPLYCNGVVRLDAKSSKIFYEKEDHTAGVLSVASANATQLEDLNKSCLPATFGLSSKDVYDESYRKARKMDVENFAINFDLHAFGIIDAIRKELLEGPNPEKVIKAELYKLNVYDEGSFFKAHKDTPRSENMFGSLVISFPTPHQGGKLLLRHDGEEWAFDSADILSKYEAPFAAWIAFYSDVEHEVTPVVSGHRVTLTYNLFYGEENEIPRDLGTLQDSSFATQSFILQTAIASLLQDDRVLPKGGYLGFGLRFMYPAFGRKGTSGLQNVLTQLKGSDALLKHVCDTLSLSITLEVVLKSSEEPCLVLVPEALDFSGTEVDSSWEWFLSDKGAKKVYDWESPHTSWRYETIMWITPPTVFPTYDSPYVAYGNEAVLSHVYGDICLVARLGPINRRETAGRPASPGYSM